MRTTTTQSTIVEVSLADVLAWAGTQPVADPRNMALRQPGVFNTPTSLIAFEVVRGITHDELEAYLKAHVPTLPPNAHVTIQVVGPPNAGIRASWQT